MPSMFGSVLLFPCLLHFLILVNSLCDKMKNDALVWAYALLGVHERRLRTGNIQGFYRGENRAISVIADFLFGCGAG